MPAISVGSVEVDVLPNTRGIYGHLRGALVPAATRAGQDAGNAAGRSFGPAMRSEVGNIGLQIGEQIGRQIAARISASVRGALRDGITQGGQTARPAAVRQGDQTGGAFGRAFRTRLQAAMQNLPRADVRLGDTGFNADLARLRARLETLSNKRIGVDIDAATALAEVERLQEQLRRLGAEHPDVNVRIDTGQAIGELEALRAEISRLDGQTANVDVDTRSAAANLHLLSTAALAFGPAIIPALPVVAAGLGAIAAAGVAAAAGIGAIGLVAIPAFKGIGSALQAQKSAQDAATNATYQGGQAAGQGASKALQQASAAQALATAERNGARQIAQAQQAVVQAKRQAADAVVQAAQRNQQAARQVQDAERSLADAQRDAKRAQEDLSDARKQAALDLEDLNTRLAGAVLSQRDAQIALTEATLERDKVLKSETSTELDKQKALLAYDQAVQRLKEQTTETSRLKTETAEANKAGVEGSDTVRNAQEGVAEAQRKVADQARAVKDAQAEAARTQVETARQVADAQQRVSEATANVAVAQQNAADSVASAQRQIASASQSAAGGVDQAAIAQAKYQAELDKLTPSARDTFNAFIDLRTAFSAWSKSLQPAVMPIFTRALNGLKNSLPGLTPFVLAAADAIGGLQDRVSRGFKSPWWKQFKTELAGSVEPAITGLGISFGRIFKGMAGVIDAFLPHMDSISARMQRITGRFATWGTSLKGSPEFERFLSYSSEMSPKLGDALGKIGSAFLNISQALSPLSGPLLLLLGGIAEAIGIIADKAPWFILLIYGIILAMKLWTIAVWAFNAAMSANPLVLIGLAILALIAIVIYAYNRFGWFRDLVQTVWAAIQTAVLWAWNNILKPTFTFIWQALQTVGRWAMWLWTNAIKPSFDLIAAAAKILLTAIVVLVLLPIIAVIKIVGAIAMWLWTHAIKPAFDLIAAHAMWLWNSVFYPVFTWIGDKAKWLWANAIKPAWDSIKAAGKALWETHLRPVFKNIWGGLQTIGKWAAWLWKEAIKPSFDQIVSIGRTAWERGIKPVFDGWRNIIRGLGGLFSDAVAAIKKQWDRLKTVARAPVQFVVDTVYNKGIVGVWNKVASAFGAPPLKKFSFASGGIMPGYTPGRDVHRFVSPTGGALELSGGEAIMRPEFTRAVGSGFVGAMNSIAKSRGAQGVKAALAPVFGGDPNTSTDRSLRYAGGGLVQSFADGGVFGWIGKAANAVAGAGSSAWNAVKKGASWLKDTLEGSARAGVKAAVNPLLKSFPGMDTGFGALIRKIPDRILDALFGYSKNADKKGAGGVGGPKIQAATKWAKTQNGLPYQWGGNGNPSWDCSGFMSAIESVIRGQKPHRRWSTHAFSGNAAPPGWVKNGNSPFRVGITHAGVGHTAGTIGKTKVESRGGDGVVVGSRARGYHDKLFSSWYGFKPGSYDSGGYLQPGMNLAFNGTGRPEPVFTAGQANALTSMAGRGLSGPMSFEGDLRLDSGEFLGRVRGEATAVMQAGQQQLIEVLNAS